MSRSSRRDADQTPVERFEAELCSAWRIPAGRIRSWKSVIPPAGKRRHPIRGRIEPVYAGDEAQFERWHQYAQILDAGCTLAQLDELIKRDAASERAGRTGRIVEMYALLAEECYGGLTPHMLRSMCVVVLYQNRLGKLLLSKELAGVAGISQERAFRHLLNLQYMGALRFTTKPPRWEFAFTPRALSRYYPD